MVSGNQIESGILTGPRRQVAGAEVCAALAAMALPVDVIW